MRGKKINPHAVKWLLKHPNALTWSKLSIAKELKRVGIYSQKTYVKDIRIDRIIQEAAKQSIVNDSDR